MKITIEQYPQHLQDLTKEFLFTAIPNILPELAGETVSATVYVAVVDRDGKKIGDVVDEQWMWDARRTHEEVVAVYLLVSMEN